MKKSIIILGMASILVSCSTTNFLKRKYTKGVYVESIAHKSQTSKNEIVSEKRVSSKNNHYQSSNLSEIFIEKSNNVKNNEVLTTNTNSTTKKMYAQNSTKKNSISNKIKSTASLVKVSASQDVNFDTHFKFLPNYFFSSFTKNSTPAPSDAEKIVWIILSLFPFINLIAVYLHDGNRVTKNFIVLLILNLLILLWPIIFYLGGLFVLASIIFALLVVLDVVNLA